MARKTYFNLLAKITFAKFYLYKRRNTCTCECVKYVEKGKPQMAIKIGKDFFTNLLQKVKWPHQHLEFVCQYHNNCRNGP